MNSSTFYIALLLWLFILVLAIANGALREQLLIPRLGSVTGLIVSGCLLSCLIILVAFIGVPWLGMLKNFEYLFIGLSWLLLTLTFEVGFGLALHKSWSELLQAYTFKGGNIWPVVLTVIALAPWLAAKLREIG